MKSKAGIFMMITGAVLILVALSLAVYNVYDDKRAGDEASEVLTLLEEEIAQNSDAGRSISSVVSSDAYSENINDHLVDAVDENKPIKIGEYSYIGIIEIPVLNISLPVMENWNYDNLSIAPCCYFGSADGGQFVIAAHNYNSHFGRIKELVKGDEVIFTDVNGLSYHYIVAEKEIISENDSNRMTADDWALSLFTCTFDGSDRVTVRCDRFE